MKKAPDASLCAPNAERYGTTLAVPKKASGEKETTDVKVVAVCMASGGPDG
jgi:hypothetical protein